MAQAVRQATVGRAKYERLGVIKEADACGVRVSLNGDSLALKASAKHRRREGSDQGVHPMYRFLVYPYAPGFRSPRPLPSACLLTDMRAGKAEPIVNAAEFQTGTLDNNQSLVLPRLKKSKQAANRDLLGSFTFAFCLWRPDAGAGALLHEIFPKSGFARQSQQSCAKRHDSYERGNTQTVESGMTRYHLLFRERE